MRDVMHVNVIRFDQQSFLYIASRMRLFARIQSLLAQEDGVFLSHNRRNETPAFDGH